MAVTGQQAAGYLNTTLSKLGYQFQIRTDTDANMIADFSAVGAFPPSQLNSLLEMQQIILVKEIFTTMFDSSNNPTREFWRNAIDYGGGIEDIYIELSPPESLYQSTDFNGSLEHDNALALDIAQDLLRYRKNNIKKKIHGITEIFKVTLSVSDEELTTLFTPNGYGRFIDGLYSNFYSSMEAIFMKKVIAKIQQMVSDNHIIYKTGYNMNNTDSVTQIVEALNTVSDGMDTLNTLYNYDQVETRTDFDNLYLVTTPEFYNRIKSRGYANVFNLDVYENKNRLIMLPAQTSLGVGPNGREIGFILLDKRAVMAAIKYYEVKPFDVANSDYRNTFAKVKMATGYTEFFQAVAFETGEVGNFIEGYQNANSYVILAFDAPGTGNANDDTIYVNGTLLKSYKLIENSGQYWDKIYEVPKGASIQIPDPDSPDVYVSIYADSFMVWQVQGNSAVFPINTEITGNIVIGGL